MSRKVDRQVRALNLVRALVTDHIEGEVPSRGSDVVPGHAGVGGCVLLALNVGDDQGAVGEDDLPVVEGKLAAVCRERNR